MYGIALIRRHASSQIANILFKHAVNAAAVLRSTQSYGGLAADEESFLLIRAFPYRTPTRAPLLSSHEPRLAPGFSQIEVCSSIRSSCKESAWSVHEELCLILSTSLASLREQVFQIFPFPGESVAELFQERLPSKLKAFLCCKSGPHVVVEASQTVFSPTKTRS